MKKILSFSFSKIYVIVMILISLLVVGGYFSYAMFTVTKEKSNAISIVTGNLTYKLLVDEEEINTLTVPANSRQDFIVTLNNPNNRVARFNFYYEGDLLEGVDIGYIEKDEFNVPPTEDGINLEKVSTAGSSNTYIVRVANTTESEISIELGVSVGLDYNDLTLPSDGHLLRKITSTGTVSEVIKDDIMNRLNYNDTEQTFVTGSDPNNYIWYSGKLWRVVSIDTSDNSVKLVTQWSISAIPYDNDRSVFEGSYMEQWLNDTTADGFLGNLRSPEKFIKMDSEWYDQETVGTVKPTGMVTIDPVGLLNIYEYNMSGADNGYINNNLFWWTLTSNDNSQLFYINIYGSVSSYSFTHAYGIRPSINLKSEVKIVAGDGTESNPYRLMGDNDSNLEGVKLNTRYSGEYISFGTGDNNLYRIVSHETEGLTKVTSDIPLKENGTFKKIGFGDSAYYSSSNTIGSFLNGEYLASGYYLTDEQVDMIEDDNTWYLGMVGSGASYMLAKYIDTNMSGYTISTTNAKIGLLRLGELMAEQFYAYYNNTDYWPLTAYNNLYMRSIYSNGNINYNNPNTSYSIKPTMNLKQNVVITGGDGTKQNPFTLELG